MRSRYSQITKKRLFFLCLTLIVAVKPQKMSMYACARIFVLGTEFCKDSVCDFFSKRTSYLCMPLSQRSVCDCNKIILYCIVEKRSYPLSSVYIFAVVPMLTTYLVIARFAL